MWLVVECGVCRLQHVLLCFVCFSRSVTQLLLVLVALSGRVSGIAGPFTRGYGEDAGVLFVSCFVSPFVGRECLCLVRVKLLVPSVFGENFCVMFESCSLSRPSGGEKETNGRVP